MVTASACGVALTGAGVLDDQPPAAFEAEDRAFELGRVSKVVSDEGVAAGVSVLTVGGLPG